MVPEHFTFLNALILIKQEKHNRQHFLEREQRQRKSMGLSVKSVTEASTQSSGIHLPVVLFCPKQSIQIETVYI